jgi:hypothetical protein
VVVVDVASKIGACLVGRSLARTELGERDWLFHFANGDILRVVCPWRILLDGRIALGDCDHAQKFGLPEPVDGPKESDRLLRDKKITRVSLRDDTGDLAIAFDGQATLEVLNTSGGYEGWQFASETGLHVVATGGGELALWTN